MLEKIFEDIELRIKMVDSIQTSEDEGVEYPDGEQCYEDGVLQGRYKELLWCRDIVRNHMDNGWIPVDERLPGTERVLITDGEIVKEGYRRSDGVWKYGIEHEKIFSKLSITGVIAWQPLPEPYKTNK